MTVNVSPSQEDDAVGDHTAAWDNRRATKVLLVEDEPLFRMAMADLLEDAGFDVTVACSGDEAVILLAENDRFDALMTDITMPGAIDGVELAEHAREIHAGLPVVFVSGVPENARRSGEVEQPMAYFPKPFDMDALLAALGRLVGTA
jgi:CheY-like chemotaxis protein